MIVYIKWIPVTNKRGVVVSGYYQAVSETDDILIEDEANVIIEYLIKNEYSSNKQNNLIWEK